MFSFYYLPFTIFKFPVQYALFDSIILLFSFFLNYFYFILGNFFLIQVLICSIQSKYISNFSITCAYKKSIFQLFPNTNLITINQTISSTLICFLNFIWRNYFTIYSLLYSSTNVASIISRFVVIIIKFPSLSSFNSYSFPLYTQNSPFFIIFYFPFTSTKCLPSNIATTVSFPLTTLCNSAPFLGLHIHHLKTTRI